MSTLSVHRLENVQDFDMANTPFVTAFNAANGAYAVTNAAFNTTNTAFNTTNVAYGFANTVNTFAYGVAVNAAAAFTAANNVGPQIAPTYNNANAAFRHANAAYDSANNVAPQVTPAYTTANLAYNNSNTGYASINSNWTVTNTVYGVANAAFGLANTKFSSSGGTISGAVEITADLTVHGNTKFIDQQTLQVGDPLIYLAANNYASDVVDIGFIANYVNTTGSNVHTGLYRSSGSKEYYLFYGYDKEPYNNYIDPTGNNITMAVLNTTVRTSNLILGGANALGTIGASFNTANAAYGAANNVGPQIAPAYNTANQAYTVANAAFGKANTSLQNTNFTLNGNLTSTGVVTLNRMPFYESTANINYDYTINTGMNAFTPGPVAIANGVYVTIPDGSYWSVT